MFDFAISHQERHRPSARFLVSLALSCALHGALLETLLRYPHILDTGIGRWFRARAQVSPLEDKDWRSVALIRASPGKMEMPSRETLRQVMRDWSKDAGQPKQPPIRVRWSAQQLAALEDQAEVGPPARPVPGLNEPQPAPPAGAAAAIAGGTAAGEQKPAFLPPPEAAPAKIPEKIAEAPHPAAAAPAPKPPETRPAAAPTAPQAQVFADRQAAIRSQGSGLFDTKGFPMGDYATLVIERVKSNWLIPSNLRNSQGSTTIVFYIARDGHFMDARIVVPSGSSSLDLAALSAIIGSSPFPPLPEGFPADRVGAKFVFSYNERQ